MFKSAHNVTAGGRWAGFTAGFWVAAGVIAIALSALLWDAAGRDWRVLPAYEPAVATSGVDAVTGAVARHVTAIFWIAYLFLLDGLFRARGGRMTAGGSPVRQRPRLFALCCVGSVAIWLTFEFINTVWVGAWNYHGLPANPVHRWTMYALAFATICPALFLTATAIDRLFRLGSLNGPRIRIPLAGQLFLGLAAVVVLSVFQGPVTSVVLFWMWIFLLDPLNRRLGGESIVADWETGRWGRTVALVAAGPVCGLLWESWNYLALAKWTYNLPFLGPLEAVRLFEMPLAGYLGYLPFGIECWVMFQTVVFVAGRILHVEPMRDEGAII